MGTARIGEQIVEARIQRLLHIADIEIADADNGNYRRYWQSQVIGKADKILPPGLRHQRPAENAGIAVEPCRRRLDLGGDQIVLVAMIDAQMGFGLASDTGMLAGARVRTGASTF